jgi:site-specific DNA-methyltransferase (adenine-specific)/adenine-specific DNA-methyltransferase
MPTLNWIGKEAVVNHDQSVPYRLIHCDGDRSVGEAGEGNLLVEGDNLHALKALLPYYRKRVKCIYIDPPYNTGNEGWVYNDNVNAPEIKKWLGETVGGEAEDLSRHDKWLCMMYPRLKLLCEFLRDDGAIFISIDDNEVAHLRAVMDEIFGQRNFVAVVTWQKRYAASNDSTGIPSMHDYILVYAKSSAFERNLLPRTEKQDKAYKNPDDDPRGPWKAADYTSNKTRQERPNLFYPLIHPVTGEEVWPKETRVWGYAKEVYEEHTKDNRLWWGSKGQNKVPAFKKFLNEVQQGIVPVTWWPHDEVGHTDEAKKEVLRILGTLPGYITPKPTRLIQRILQIATDKDSIVLDSFAGSGTTGHAVLQLNKEDGGQRRFILIEMEPEICRNITAERLRRVIEGRGEGGKARPTINRRAEKTKPGEPGSEGDGLGGGFRYCTLGEPLFDERGQIREKVRFGDLARHIFFTETGEPLPRPANGRMPFVAEHNGTAYYLLWRGEGAANVLDSAALKKLGKHDGPKVVYADGCRLSPTQLRARGVVFKQVPYEIKAG